MEPIAAPIFHLEVNPAVSHRAKGKVNDMQLKLIMREAVPRPSERFKAIATCLYWLTWKRQGS